MDLVNSVLGGAHDGLAWGVSNAVPIAVGALLGSTLWGAGLGLVSDVLGRAQAVVKGVSDSLAGK